MTDLIAFLRARLDEDEAADLHERKCGAGYYGAPCTCGWRYRKVREIEAKRAILAEHASLGPFTSFCHTCLDDARTESTEAAKQLHPCLTLRHLAAVYSDHPDYRQEWAL